MHIRRWTHVLPIFKQSSQPFADGFNLCIWFRWVHCIAALPRLDSTLALAGKCARTNTRHLASKLVIMSGVFRSFIARGEVEGPPVAFAVASSFAWRRRDLIALRPCAPAQQSWVPHLRTLEHGVSASATFTKSEYMVESISIANRDLNPPAPP